MVTPGRACIFGSEARCERDHAVPAGRVARARCRAATASTRRTGTARARTSCCVQRCGGCGGWQWGPEWSATAATRFDLRWEEVDAARPHLLAGSACGIRCIRRCAARPLHRRPGRAAARRRRAHGRQPARRSAASASPSARRWTAVFEPHDDADAAVHAGALEEERMSTTELAINEPNLWRLKTPGHASWPRTARPGDPKKYFIVSADAHVNEPADLWATRIDAKYRERIPRVIVDANGVKWRVSEGHRPDRLRTDELEGEDRLRQLAGADPVERAARHGPRRHRRRGDVPQQGPLDVGHARRAPSPWPCAASTTTGRGKSFAPLQRPHVAGRGHRHRRSRGLHRRGPARGQARLPRR